MTLVLISTFMCDIVRSFLAERLWPRITQAVTRMSAWRLNWGKLRQFLAGLGQASFKLTPAGLPTECLMDRVAASHIRIQKTFKGKGFQKDWTTWAHF